MNKDQSLGQCPGHTLMNNLIPADLDPVSCCRRKKTEDLVEEQRAAKSWLGKLESENGSVGAGLDKKDAIRY